MRCDPRCCASPVQMCMCAYAAALPVSTFSALSLAREGVPLRLVIAIPCPEQAKYYSARDRALYERLCAAAECVTLSDRYTRYCMLERNRYMVDRAGYLICYLRESRGGTYQTRAYAEMKNRCILDL